MKTLIPLLLVLLFTGQAYGQKDKISKAKATELQVANEKVPPKLLKEILATEEVREALEILALDGATLNQSTPIMHKNGEGDYEVQFDIIDRKSAYDYTKMGFVRTPEVTYVYFDIPNKKYAEPTEEEKLARWGGCKWTGWSYHPWSNCYSNWWCGRKWNRQATYQYQVKYKICRNGIIKKIKYRLVKRRCGC